MWDKERVKTLYEYAQQVADKTFDAVGDYAPLTRKDHLSHLIFEYLIASEAIQRSGIPVPPNL